MNDPITYPVWFWAVFFTIVLIALFVDIRVVESKAHTPSRRETFFWGAVWVALALGFNLLIYLNYGGFKATEFLTGYLIELSLSIDNLFVFLLIFTYFKVPKKYEHRVLFWGILMALGLRLVMIFAGTALVARLHWTLYIAGVFLLYTGVRMFGGGHEFEPEESAIVKVTTRIVPVSNSFEGDRFFVLKDGSRVGTLLLLVLIVINVADLLFAVDSIPAIFGITTDRFIVYTSNIFAVVGLRTFYFLLSDMADKFHYLKYGLAFVLSFIGIKMLLPLFAAGLIMVLGDGSPTSGLLQRFLDHEFDQMVINLSLAIVGVAIIVSIILSLIFPSKHRAADRCIDRLGDGR